MQLTSSHYFVSTIVALLCTLILIVSTTSSTRNYFTPNRTTAPTKATTMPALSIRSTFKLNSGYELPLLGFGVSMKRKGQSQII